MDYYRIKVTTHPENSEALIALFSTLPFDTFQETETGFDAYLPAKEKPENLKAQLLHFGNLFDFSLEEEFIKGENWNEKWESNFSPIQVGNFCGIRAGFHQPIKGVEHEIIINPKMAFGTGHHETTFSVIQLMKGLDFNGKKVFDYGCGTGILAILASRLRAEKIVAVDIEEESYLNTIENCQHNGIDNVQAIHGTLKDVPSQSYGIVLANINRNVILNSLESLAEMTQKGGFLVVSGIMLSDREIVSEAIEANGFLPLEIIKNGNWLAINCQRS